MILLGTELRIGYMNLILREQWGDEIILFRIE